MCLCRPLTGSYGVPWWCSEREGGVARFRRPADRIFPSFCPNVTSTCVPRGRAPLWRGCVPQRCAAASQGPWPAPALRGALPPPNTLRFAFRGVSHASAPFSSVFWCTWHPCAVCSDVCGRTAATRRHTPLTTCLCLRTLPAAAPCFGRLPHARGLCARLPLRRRFEACSTHRCVTEGRQSAPTPPLSPLTPVCARTRACAALCTCRKLPQSIMPKVRHCGRVWPCVPASFH